MWMRRGLGSSWKGRDLNDSDHVSKAVEDLIRRPDDKPSFFLVQGCEEVHRLGELFCATVLPGPQTTDFLLLPETGLTGFFFSFASDPNLHPELQQKHFELQGMESSPDLERFIRRAFGIVLIERLQRRFLGDAFRERLCHEADVFSRCGERWKRLL
jgi:hypothetical protein